MNTLRLIILSIFLFLSFGIYAQEYREIDIDCKFISPENGSYFKLPQTLNIVSRVKNIGPDTIFPMDTLMYRLKLSIKNASLKFYQIENVVAPGDSIFIYDTLELVDVGSSNKVDAALLWTSGPVIFNNDKNNVNGPILYSYDEFRFENNKDTFYYDYETQNSSVLDLKINETIFYPNPTTENINLLNANNIIGYKVIGELGNVLISEVNEVGTLDLIELGHLDKGCYFILLYNRDGTHIIKKLIKQK